MNNKYIVFDLDDTLVYEIDYLKSAYKEIANVLDKKNSHGLYLKMISLYKKDENVFQFLVNKYTDYSLQNLLTIYRNHYPELSLNKGAKEVINYCKNQGYKLGLITDGRSTTQRNKLKALKIIEAFDKIIISEEFGSSKPDEHNYEIFVNKEITSYFYIADNTKKDFLTPNKLGWKSICLLDNGQNIHPQNFDLKEEYLPTYTIKTLQEICGLI